VKTILEAGLVRENAGRYVLTGPVPPLAIPATLQDALMARLDRLALVKDVAQLGAVLGREFTYELLQAVAPQDEATVQQALTQLVDAELLYQRGRPPQATYRFKHALIQDTAYQSLLKSTRQQAHQRIAQVLTTDFPAIADTQPELLAHHYTEAGLRERAIGYWQQAGQRSIARSAHVEALTHLTKGLELLATLPATPAHTQQALTLHLALGTALTAIRGYGAPEVERTYTRARALCQQGGESPQLIPVLFGLWRCYIARRDYQTARAVAEQCLALAQRGPDAAALLRARTTLGVTLFYRGEFLPARTHLEQGRVVVAPPRRRAHAFVQDPLVACCTYAAQTLWCLGYPDQAQRQSQEALTLAQELAHPFSLAFAHAFAAALHQFGRDWQAAQAWAEAAITLSTAQEFPVWWAMGTLVRGWALATQGQGDEGMAQLRQGLDAMHATEGEVGQSWYLAMLAETYGKVGRAEDGLEVLAEVLAAARHSGERVYEAELYRLRGELLLQSVVPSLEAGVPRLQTICHAPAVEAAAACFHEALAIARLQQAKAWELRAALSLSRLWQQQGKRAEARTLLTPVYGWFTEGWDTADLQEAKALLEALEG
jgi:predicted ATPase